MAVTVWFLDEQGAPLPKGLGVELLQDRKVLAEARTDGGGAVSFEVDPAGSFAVRVRASDDVVGFTQHAG